MKYIIIKTNRNIPDETLLKDLRKAARKLGKLTISCNDYQAEGSFSVCTFILRFGGWNAALQKARLKISQMHGISKGELLLNLKQVWDRLKRQPRAAEMARPLSKYSTGLYVTRFGSWMNALEAFGKFVQAGAKVVIVPKQRKRKKQYKPRRRNVSKSLRYDVLTRDNFRCRLCGRSPATDMNIRLHVDHIKPCAKGGTNTISNLQTLCNECNIGKSAK